MSTQWRLGSRYKNVKNKKHQQNEAKKHKHEMNLRVQMADRKIKCKRRGRKGVEKERGEPSTFLEGA